jgi:type IV pilus assembly protein PilV
MSVRHGQSRAHGRQRGFTMLEILVTLFLVTMWLLGTASVQSSSLRLNSAAQFRTQAVFLATEIAERMQANRAAAIGGLYEYSGDGSQGQTVDCVGDGAGCAPETLATFDLDEWSGRVRDTLPSATMTIARVDPGTSPNLVTYEIVIRWDDRREDGATSGATESFSYRSTRTIFLES